MLFKKKTTGRRRASKKIQGALWPKILFFFLLLCLFVGSIGAAFFVIFLSVPPLHAAEYGAVLENPPLPRVAIIIDDMGYNKQVGEALIQLPYDLSFSFLPFAPSSKSLQRSSYIAGKTMLIHLPLEPIAQDINLEPRTLLIEQNAETQQQLFEENVAEVSYATGMNNHMGSLFTADPLAMKRIMQLAEERGYFFVDSVTTLDSVGDQTAESLGMSHAKRDVFLDNVAEQGAICAQLLRLVAIAEKKGSAIGIGHPYPETLLALQKCLKSALKGAYLVPVDELVGKRT